MSLIADPAEQLASGLRSTVLIDGLTFSTDTQRPDPSFSLIPLNFVDDERLLHAISKLRWEVLSNVRPEPLAQEMSGDGKATVSRVGEQGGRRPDSRVL